MPKSSRTQDLSELLAGWSHKTADIPECGLETERIASADELEAIATALDVPACRTLEAHYVIRPIGGERFRVQGNIEAAVTQTCIVSLEPVEATIAESFDEEYWPAEQIPPPGQGAESEEHEALANTAPEPIEQGVIALGRLVYELLSTALDPYPRAPGVDFTWSEPVALSERGEAAGNPFAALAVLKDRPKGGR